MRDWPQWMRDQFWGALLLFAVINALGGLIALVLVCCGY